MATRIFDLQCLVFDMVVGTNEDWRDSWPYLDAAGQGISVDGTDFDFALRSPKSGALVVVASTSSSVGGLPLNGVVARSGFVVGLRIPRATMLRLPPLAGYAHETQARAAGITKTVARGFVTITGGLAP